MGVSRRERLMARLQVGDGPVSGTELAAALGVSRQVVVQDIAILRAAGEPILATSRGYLLPDANAGGHISAILAVRHPPDATVDELYTLVDHGLRIVDVIVDHPFYGELRGVLMLESRADIDSWWAVARASGARLLSELTDGLHLHTVTTRSPANLERARAALRARGFLVEEAGACSTRASG